jgi:hypothetical protein
VSRLPIGLLALGVALMGLGWWGMSSRAGRRIFDEMAGMIPMACLGLGLILLIVGTGLGVWRSRS